MTNITNPMQIQTEVAKGTWKPNLYLTNIAIASFQSDEDFAASKIFPVVPVALSSSYYYKFSKGDLARDDVQRKPVFGRVAPSVLGQTDELYNCQVDQVIVGIDQISQLNFERSGVPGMADPRQSKVRAVVEKMKIHLDVKFADKFFKTGVWTNEYKGIGTGTAGGKQFYQFNNDNSSPIIFFDSLITDMRKNGCRKPNKLALGIDTFNALKNNKDILERIKYHGGSARPSRVTEQVLAELFGLEQVVVMASTYNKAGIGEEPSMEYICDPKGALLVYASNNPAIDEPSAGYTFAWDMLGSNQFMAVSQYDGDPGTHSEFIEGLIAYDMKKTGDDLGIYLSDCVGTTAANNAE